MTYTKEISNQKYFLNDKNISQSLSDSSDGLNPIPSLTLVSALYNELSTEDRILNNYISDVEVSANGISSAVNSICAEMTIDINAKYNTLNGKISKLSSDLSSDIDKLSSDLSGDIDKLSSDLSGDIDKLSSDLSNAVNVEFVHKSGDIVNGDLSVSRNISAANRLNASGNVVFDKDLIVKQSLYVGSNNPNTTVLQNTILLGNKARTEKQNTFVWNGLDEEYTAHTGIISSGSTFNINPADGIKGVYVGEKSLSDIIHDDTALTSEAINDRISSLSSTVSSNYALSCDVSAVSKLSNDAGYLISSDFHMNYVKDDKRIYLSAGSNVLTVDTTDFIKDGMLSTVVLSNVVDPDDETKTTKALILTWNTDAGITQTTIILKSLIDIYTSNTPGISVEDYKIGLDYSVVGKVSDIQDNLRRIDILSTQTLPKLSTDLNAVSGHVDSIQSYCTRLSGDPSKSYPDPEYGIIPTLRYDVDHYAQLIKYSAAFAGHISLKRGENYKDNTISGIFDYFNLGMGRKIKSGNMYQITILSVEANEDDRQKAYFDTTDADPLRLVNNDYIVVHSHDKDSVTFDDLRQNIEIIPAVRYHEFHSLSATTRDNYFWLSGGNCISAKWGGNDNQLCSNHAISGNNDFLGLNRFEEISVGSVSADLLSAYRADIYDISVGNNISVGNKLSVATEVDFLSGNVTIKEDSVEIAYQTSISNNLSVGNTLTVDMLSSIAYATNISAGSVSVDWSNAYHTNGFTLEDLSNAVSNKIWISDDVDYQVSGTSDLSIMKMKKDDFDKYVALSSEAMSSNTLYVVDADYLDAYGQVLCNLVMPSDNTQSYAATQHYVDQISSNLSIEIKNLSNVVQISVSNLQQQIISNDNDIEFLSTAISNKIWISDDVDYQVSGTSDLSIIKMKKADFDNLVLLSAEAMSSNTMYVVDADYIDAYGQVLCNLVMPSDTTPSYAASQHYVDQISSNVQSFIDSLYSGMSVDFVDNDGNIKAESEVTLSNVIHSMHCIFTILSAYKS